MVLNWGERLLSMVVSPVEKYFRAYFIAAQPFGGVEGG